jgi:hypothetical protein
MGKKQEEGICRVVRPERFELPTFWFVARRSIQLSYRRIEVAHSRGRTPRASRRGATALPPQVLDFL